MSMPVAAKAPEQIGQRWTGTYDRPWLARGTERFLSKDTRFFAIGSCFAVNFTRWLIAQGLPSRLPEWGLHYNPATIHNELLIASGRGARALVWKVNDRRLGEVYVDCLRHTIFGKTEKELAARRAEIAAAGQSAYREANAVLITLGLGEVWEQATDYGPVVINRAPYPGSPEAERCANRFLSVAEAKGYLMRIVAMIREDKGEDIPIVFTISPIPLKSTGVDYDPQSANCRSKALLLAALHEVIDADKSGRPLTYFPAFELFFGGPRPFDFWQEDFRHPTAKAVSLVCRKFIELFAKDPAKFDFDIPFAVPVPGDAR